jgi:hypothetical protein
MDEGPLCEMSNPSSAFRVLYLFCAVLASEVLSTAVGLEVP